MTRARPGAVRTAAGVALAVLALAACGAGPGPAGAPQPGAYAIATPGAAVLSTPTASDRHYQLVSAGDVVRADIGAAQLRAQVSGPDLTVPPGPPPDHVQGRLTIDLRSEHGALAVPTSSFLLLDQAQHPIAVQADSAVADVSPASPAVVHLTADLPVGHATLTWQPTGHPMVTWDFTVEVD